MSGKFLILFTACLALFACAHPNYVEKPQDAFEAQLGSCDLEFKASDLCASLSWEYKPSEERKGSFVLEFHGDRDASQFVDLINTLAVTLWMPSMGHGSTPVKVDHLGNGQYRVSDVFFIMHGDWEIQVQIKKGDQVLDQVVYPVHY